MNLLAIGCFGLLYGYITFSLCQFAGAHYFLRRNRWVFETRMGLLRDEGHAAYLTLPSYRYMLYDRWWVWRFEEFMPGGRHHRASPSHRFGG